MNNFFRKKIREHLLLFPSLILIFSCTEQSQENNITEIAIEKSLIREFAGLENKDTSLSDSLLLNYLPDSGLVLNKLKEGKWIEYSLDTLLIYTGLNTGGKEMHLNFESSPVAETGNYLKGKREGSWVTYKAYSRKTPLMWDRAGITIYFKGKKNGNEFLFSHNDTMAIRSYINGIEHGIEKVFDPNSPHTLIQLFKAENGKVRLLEEYYPSGSLKTKFTDTVLKGKVLVAFKTFYAGNKKESEGFYNNNELDGSYKYFHYEGNLWTEQIYNEGNLMEVMCNYSASGKIKDKGTLKNGNGTLIRYHESGFPLDTTVYLNGQEKKN